MKQKTSDQTTFPKQTVSNPNYSGKQQIIDTENGMPIYSKSIVKKLYKGLDIKNDKNFTGEIVDFGAGTGYLAQIFQDSYLCKVIGVEIDPVLQALIVSKGINCVNNIENLQQEIGYIYSSNVLEHIEDDLGLLKQLNNKLINGGKLGLYLPALPMLYSEMDKQIGHYRRYTKKELRIKLNKAGFIVERIHYDDPIGVLASMLVKILKYNKFVNLPNLKALIFYDRFIYPISNLFGILAFRKVTGKNLLVIARKIKQNEKRFDEKYGSLEEYYSFYFDKICYGNRITSRSMSVIHKAIEKKHCKMFYQRTLELGAGSGQHLDYVKHGFEQYLVTDLKKPVIREIYKIDKRIKTRAVNAEKIPYTSNYFDRIVITCLLHHVDQPEIALTEVNRVLKKNGSATIFLPCDPGLLLRIIRSVTSARKAKKIGFEGYNLLNARDHRNHVSSLLRIIQFVFSDRKIRIRYLPFYIKSWNLNTYILIEIN